MKKTKCLSLLLCLILMLQCILIPAMAVETIDVPQETISSVSETTAKPEFGTVSIVNGCRTIEGMAPLGGGDRRLESAQSVFLYEITTDTVVYSYNPDLKVHPGTLAKMVLSLLVLENCDRDEMVTVTEGIQAYIPAGSNTIKLKSFEQI